MQGERVGWPGALVGIYQVVQMVFYIFKNWYGCTHIYRYGWALPRWEKIEPSPCFLRVFANESFLIHQETWAQVPLPLYLHREPSNSFWSHVSVVATFQLNKDELRMARSLFPFPLHSPNTHTMAHARPDASLVANTQSKVITNFGGVLGVG